MSEEQRQTGTVKFFNHKSKFGFIRVDSTDSEIYVHQKDCEDTLTDGDRVSFCIEQAKRGPIATGVTRV